MPEQRTIVNIPFTGGLSQRSDARASNPPNLDIALDIQVDELGGIQTRKPYAALGSNIFGGGTISNARQIVDFGSELLLFTNTALYSWNAQLSVWVLKGTHLAVKVSEATAFATTGDQINGDRAELSNTVLYAWEDSSRVWVAASDKTTGSVLMAPTQIAGTGTRPRLVALATKVMLFWHTGTDGAPVSLVCIAIDPTTPATAVAGASTTVLATPNFGSYYDVTRVIGADTAIVGARRVTTTSYSVIKVTAALAVTASTKARTCDGPIAVSCDPTGTSVQVVRANATNIQGDLVTISSLADSLTGQAIGTAVGTVNQIAAAHRSVQTGGQYRCYAFWSSSETSDTIASFATKSNWVDVAGGLGTEASFVSNVGVGSRAFDYNGSVYLSLAFAAVSAFTISTGGAAPQIFGTLQNTYFLYRDDGFLCAKMANGSGGGYSPSIGHLPGVALTSGSTVFSWCATERRRIDLGSNLMGYSARAPRDVTFTFDSNEARRTARLGKTLYITGGELLQYDGYRLVEVGFHIYPWRIDATDWAAGNLAAGQYAYKMSWRYDNGTGERERSTSATSGLITVGASRETSVIPWNASNLTHKTTVTAAAELWRTAVNPTSDAPFYLVTSSDPSATANPNRYLANDPTVPALATVLDSYADATAITKETHPENGSVLESIAPPACTLILATDTRLFLAGIAGDPNRVWYSKLRDTGELAAFNDALTIEVPSQGGSITGLAWLNETLVVFRQFAIYAFPGQGYDNLGEGQNYGPAQILSSDIGARMQESIALMDQGLIFKSSKGWYVLDKRWAASYVGGNVYTYDSETVYAAHVVGAQQQVRLLSDQRMIVLDTVAGQWLEWTIADGLDACIWNGTYTYLTTTGPKTEQTSFAGGTTYGLDVETPWIKVNDLQGAGSIRRMMIVGEYRSAHNLRIRLAYNYDESNTIPNYIDDQCLPIAVMNVGAVEQVKIGPSRQKCEAIKVRVTAVAEGVHATIATNSGDMDNILLMLGTWTATLSAVPLGEQGNTITVTWSFDSGSPFSIDVRDHFAWDQANQRWTEQKWNVGIRVVCTAGSKPTAAQLETAIATSKLLTVSVHHGTPSDTIDTVSMLAHSGSGLFARGTYTAPAGEALKLTGLALEVGVRPDLFKRLPASQRI